MNDQEKVQSVKLPDDEHIDSAWLDVKLCTVQAIKRQQDLARKNNKESNSNDGIALMQYYNELHYGNYE